MRRALLGGAVAGTVTAAVDAALARVAGGSLERVNHRGRTVSLRSGPALVLGAVVSGGPATWVAGLGSAATGAYDDALGGRDRAKGLSGHARALRQGRLTGGSAKVVGIGGSALLSVGLLPRRPAGRLLADAALVAGTANLLNLLDLRPGRALKAGAATALALGLPGPAAAAAVVLPSDLGERTMLGDTGANGLGAVLGVGLVERLSPNGRAAALAGVVALTLASERVSFSAVIDRTPWLRALDTAGRLP